MDDHIYTRIHTKIVESSLINGDVGCNCRSSGQPDFCSVLGRQDAENRSCHCGAGDVAVAPLSNGRDLGRQLIASTERICRNFTALGAGEYAYWFRRQDLC